MGDFDRWQGGEILKRMEYAGVVEPYATKELTVLHGIHDVLRQTLAGRADNNNAWEQGDRVMMTPAYHQHYEAFLRDVMNSMSHYRIQDKKYFEARKIVTDIVTMLEEECFSEKTEDPQTFFKRVYKSCSLEEYKDGVLSCD